jgi:tetratricopeptide (TPR) repeat protein
MKRLLRSAVFTMVLAVTGLGWAQTASQSMATANKYYTQKDYARAAQYYEAATRLDPFSAQAYQGLGNSYYALGRNSEALAAYEKSLNLNPSNAQVAQLAQSLRTRTQAKPTAKTKAPIPGNGAMGIGLEAGGPGDFGIVGKYWLDKTSAFQPAIKLAGSTVILQLDYLWHEYFSFQPEQGSLPIYLGGGADLAVQNGVAIGARGIVGLSYIFGRPVVPLDVYVQFSPAIWFGSGGASGVQFYFSGGSRYYF